VIVLSRRSSPLRLLDCYDSSSPGNKSPSQAVLTNLFLNCSLICCTFPFRRRPSGAVDSLQDLLTVFHDVPAFLNGFPRLPLKSLRRREKHPPPHLRLCTFFEANATCVKNHVGRMSSRTGQSNAPSKAKKSKEGIEAPLEADLQLPRRS